jgi:hypothetical protein
MNREPVLESRESSRAAGAGGVSPFPKKTYPNSAAVLARPVTVAGGVGSDAAEEGEGWGCERSPSLLLLLLACSYAAAAAAACLQLCCCCCCCCLLARLACMLKPPPSAHMLQLLTRIHWTQ